MDLREDKLGNVTILEAKGRVDSATAPSLGDRLGAALAAGGSRIVLDLKMLDYISSAGFRVLLLAGKRAEETGGRLVLCGLSGQVHRLFDVAGFLDLFRVCGTRDEALSLFS